MILVIVEENLYGFRGDQALKPANRGIMYMFCLKI